MPLLLVMIGGAFGSALRYLAGRAAVRWIGSGLPWGTLFVNVAGGFAMGALAGLLVRHPGASNESIRLLVGVGLLGGFTTFSSFSLETVLMLQRGETVTALAYVLVSAAGAIGALALGMTAVRVA